MATTTGAMVGNMTTHAMEAHTEDGAHSEGSEHSETEVAVLFVAFALFLGAVTRQFAKAIEDRVKIPYTAVLLVLGLVLGSLHDYLGLLGESFELVSEISPHLFLAIFLPMLIFESAFSLPWHTFYHSSLQAISLAGPGMIMATAMTGVIVHEAFQKSWTWPESLLLGSLLSATDPVAVVALLKELGASPRLGTLIEGESLLNDGSAIVLFTVLLEIVQGVNHSASSVTEVAFRLVLGGIALGLLFAIVTIFWLSRVIDDRAIEVTLTLASAYLLFFVAESVLEVSGVLALVVFGASFAAYGKGQVSATVRHDLHTFWTLLTYHGNTLVFVYAGVIMAVKVKFQNFGAADYGNAILLWMLLIVIRGIVFIILAPVLRSPRFGYPVEWRQCVVCVWGGLRGAVSLALALIVALAREGGDLNAGLDPVSEDVRNFTLFYASAVALLTLTVNASTTSVLIRFLGLNQPNETQFALFQKNLTKLDRTSLRRIQELSSESGFAAVNWREVWGIVLDKKYRMAVDAYCGFDYYDEAERTSKTTELDPVPLPSARHSIYGSVKKRMSLVSMTNFDEDSAEAQRSDLETKNLLKDARERFLSSTKSIYESQAELGYLNGTALTLLMQTADTAEDQSGEPLNEWEISLKPTANKAEALRRSGLRGGGTALRTVYQAVVQFVHAHKKAINTLAAAVSTYHRRASVDVEATVREECWKNIRGAESFLFQVEEAHPKVVTTMRSILATHLILQHRLQFISKFSKYGLFTTREANLLQGAIHKAEASLRLRTRSVRPPEPRAIVRKARIFNTMPPNLFNEAWEMSEPRVFPDCGLIIVERGQPADTIGIHVLTKGTAVLQAQGTRVRHLGVGSVIGALETYGRTDGVATVTTHSEAETRFFSIDAIRQVAGDDLSGQVLQNLAWLSAHTICQCKWKAMNDAVCGPHAPSAVPPSDDEILGSLMKNFYHHSLRKGVKTRFHHLAVLVSGRMREDKTREYFNAVTILAYDTDDTYTTIGHECIVIEFPGFTARRAETPDSAGDDSSVSGSAAGGEDEDEDFLLEEGIDGKPPSAGGAGHHSGHHGSDHVGAGHADQVAAAAAEASRLSRAKDDPREIKTLLVEQGKLPSSPSIVPDFGSDFAGYGDILQSTLKKRQKQRGGRHVHGDGPELDGMPSRPHLSTLSELDEAPCVVAADVATLDVSVKAVQQGFARVPSIIQRHTSTESDASHGFGREQSYGELTTSPLGGPSSPLGPHPFSPSARGRTGAGSQESSPLYDRRAAALALPEPSGGLSLDLAIPPFVPAPADDVAGAGGEAAAVVEETAAAELVVVEEEGEEGERDDQVGGLTQQFRVVEIEADGEEDESRRFSYDVPVSALGEAIDADDAAAAAAARKTKESTI